MKIVFLDFDGVVSTTRSYISAGILGKSGSLDPIVVGMVNRLLETEPDIQLVISSTWREHNSRDEIQKKLQDAGFTEQLHKDWATPHLASKFRGDEIRSWLEQHPEVSIYVCLDDEKFFYPDQPLVLVNQDDGMSFQNFLQASKFLFGDEHAWHKSLVKKNTASQKFSTPTP